MIFIALAILSLVLALIPFALYCSNVKPFCELDAMRTEASSGEVPSVSLLIPARDEATSISDCVKTAQASERVNVEIVVLDDHSSDGTGDIVRQIGSEDDRVRCIDGADLPEGWNGKQHACWQLAQRASHDLLIFLDADVRLKPDAIARLVERKAQSGVALLSAFPHQKTGSILEHLLIPMMHYILLGYLPIKRMRSNNDPAFAAGCGQLFLTSKTEYQAAGTHEAIRASRHDGIKLPRQYRSQGLSSDVIDGTNLASCRMYHGAAEMIRGVLKNATEGVANPRLIGVFTILLLGANVLPIICFFGAHGDARWFAQGIALLGGFLACYPRLHAAFRFRQSKVGAALHPVAVLVFVCLQWVALIMYFLGRQVAWRGRQ